MANLKEIRTRISSIKTTSQVTGAMKMVAAARLKKAQDAILQMRPYADKLHEVFTMLGADVDDDPAEMPFLQQRKPERVLVVLICSNRGLCGSFNTSISKAAYEMASVKYSSLLRDDQVSFLTVGKQGEKYLRSRGLNISDESNRLWEELDFEHASGLAERLMGEFAGKKWDRIELVYNQFKNAAVQIPVTEQFLPLELKQENKEKPVQSNYIYEPSRKRIMNKLVPLALKVQFYKALLDSNAAEQGARMTAMHQATDNATELIRELTIVFNKARQAAITNQIIEVTSGADALKG